MSSTTKHFDVEGRVAREQQRNDAKHLEIMHVLSGQNLARNHGRERCEKQEIDRCRKPWPDPSGAKHRTPTEDPDQKQHEQRPAGHRQPTRPVRHRSEKEACDDSGDVAVNQLVDVPFERRKSTGQSEASSKDG